MLGLIPIKVDVPMYRVPWANVVLMTAVVAVSLLALYSEAVPAEQMVLDGWSITGLFGHMLLHADLFHLIGNMIFLWAFGNAVCAKVGNWTFIGLFVLLGLLAAAAHNVFDPSRAIGASGAINGVVGLFLVFYPRNDLTCLWIFMFRVGTFTVTSYWIIMLWLGFDLWGAATRGAGVAYWAHLGGLVAGVCIGVLGLKTGWFEMEEDEQSLLEVLALPGDGS